MKNILGIVGSLRVNSLNGQLMEAIKKEAVAKGFTLTIASIKDIPLYNQDMEKEFPASVIALKDQIKAADAIIVSTPEYNRSIPGVLKNAIDWTSRPYNQGAWNGKIVAVVGATAAGTGTMGAQQTLRTVLLYMNSKVLGQPEFYGTIPYEKYTATDNFTDEASKKRIDALLDALAAA